MEQMLDYWLGKYLPLGSGVGRFLALLNENVEDGRLSLNLSIAFIIVL